jgi:hypothetical protein
MMARGQIWKNMELIYKNIIEIKCKKETDRDKDMAQVHDGPEANAGQIEPGKERKVNVFGLMKLKY